MTNGGTREERKNILLCSDGTGQTGARVGGTNVWKIRQAVDRHDHIKDPSLRRQITFYDAGVGTSAFSVKKMLGGAFGYGLAANMRQLYTNLCKTYRDGDKIYIFGFSRGAFTARSLAGMISEVGVIDGRRDNEEVEALVKRAYDAYRASKKNQPIKRFQEDCARRDIRIYDAPIHFVGVWDTVDAYGMPVDELRVLIYDKLLYNIKRAHNDGLTPKMEYAYQAIAIDEDRNTFAPTMYDEKQAAECGVTCEQVWFAGAHSNVGGGYARQGLSDLALYWMMRKAEACGLRFTRESIEAVQRDMDAHSTLYDQRSGGGAIWRYKPRNLGELCKEANAPVRVHVSAMDRMRLATADYGPITLPADFEVAGSDTDDEERVARFTRCVQATREERQAAIGPAWKEIGKRRWLYRLFLTVLVGLVVLICWLMYGDGAAEAYQASSPTHTALVWIGDKLPSSITDSVATAWSWVTKAAVYFSPGPVKMVTTALFQIPGVLVFIAVAAIVLLRLKKRRLAILKHLGLDLWRKCFEQSR